MINQKMAQKPPGMLWDLIAVEMQQLLTIDSRYEVLAKRLFVAVSVIGESCENGKDVVLPLLEESCKTTRIIHILKC